MSKTVKTGVNSDIWASYRSRTNWEANKPINKYSTHSPEHVFPRWYHMREAEKPIEEMLDEVFAKVLGKDW